MMTLGSTVMSTPVVFFAPSVRPQTCVASDRAYVVGTATIGRPLVIAIALARPVVEPPPTLTSASMPFVFAAALARSATSTGTCMTTSSWRRATGMPAAISSARCISAFAAISMTRVAPRAVISLSRLAVASPEPKQTRCGRVSWTKRMPSIFRLPSALDAQQGREGVAQFSFRAGGHGHGAPADELVRPDQQDAVLLDLADPRPVVVLSLIHISEPTRLGMISYAVFCLKKKKNKQNKKPN